MNARILPVDAAEYHADPCATPSLSASVAAVLVKQSPLHAWLKHPRLGGAGAVRETTAEQARGTLIHALVLGKGEQQVEIIHAENYRTKAAQESRDAANFAGLTPILAREFDAAKLVADSILLQLGALGIKIEPAYAEQVLEWTEETPEGPCLCRCMMDHVDFDSGVILDLKTIRSAHPDSIRKHVFEYGYDSQRAAYCSALRHYKPDLAGRESFRWIFAEELPTGLKHRAILTIAEADGQTRGLGEAKWEFACKTWAKCLRENNWPAYLPAGEVARIEPKPWDFKEEKNEHA